MLKWLKIMLMLHDPRILRVPLRVLRELRRRGIERLPGAVGAGTFWSNMTQWIAEGKDSQAVLDDIEASWP